MSNTQASRLRARGRRIVGIVRGSIQTFARHNGLQTGGALAYYALLSLAPLLLIVVSLASIFFSDDAVRVELLAQIERLIGSDGAGLAETVLRNATNESEDQLSLTIGTALLLVGASTVFAQLQSALNRVWGVEAAPERAWLGFLRHRLLSLALVLTIGFLLLVSLSFDAMLAAIQDVLGRDAGETWILIAVNRLSTFLLATVLLVLILKYLPDAEVKWRATCGLAPSLLPLSSPPASGPSARTSAAQASDPGSAQPAPWSYS